MSDHVMTAETATALRKPFPAEVVGKLPKPYKSDSQRGDCRECGGYHGLPAVHLDYVGHAAVTDRLLTVDPDWTWDFALHRADGTPVLDDGSGNLWINLTICGVTRKGVGDGKNAKERIGDAIRNAAMRFGVALDLWAKENLIEFAQAISPPAPAPVTAETARILFHLFSAKGIPEAKQLAGINAITDGGYEHVEDITEEHARQVAAALRQRPDVAPQQPVGGEGSSEGEASEPPPSTGVDVPPGGGDDGAGAAEVGGAPAPSTKTPPRPSTRAQHRMIFATLKDIGVDDDRDERLLIASTISGRTIGSFDNLTSGEAAHLIETLSAAKDKPGLNTILDGLTS